MAEHYQDGLEASHRTYAGMGGPDGYADASATKGKLDELSTAITDPCCYGAAGVPAERTIAVISHVRLIPARPNLRPDKTRWR